MLETRISFDTFADMADEDPESASARVVDSAILQNLKQVRTAGLEFVAEDLRPEGWEESEGEIASRYEPDELKRMKRHGFSGISIADRAKKTGHDKVYNIFYRVFSQNVHGTDHREHIIAPWQLRSAESEYFVNLRAVAAIHLACFAAGGVAASLDSIFNCAMAKKLASIETTQARLWAGFQEAHPAFHLEFPGLRQEPSDT